MLILHMKNLMILLMILKWKYNSQSLSRDHNKIMIGSFINLITKKKKKKRKKKKISIVNPSELFVHSPHCHNKLKWRSSPLYLRKF